ncbi:MAG: hypothetical protein MK108_15375, partial [Mariniblastus sp.]|nr:hypothetical protein [Mariniblastus sp.]
RLAEQPKTDVERGLSQDPGQAQLPFFGGSTNAGSLASASTTTLTESQALLERSANSMVESPPVESTVVLTVDLFDQQLVTEGKYIQLGQGSRKSRLDFEYQDEDIGRLTQICDGRFFYSLQESSQGKNLNFVDLYQLAKADQQALMANPTAWMATGGLSSLLQHLAQAFEFEPISQGEVGGIPTLVLRGTWKLPYLKRLMENQVEPTWLDPPIQWDLLPPQLPHSVEVHLGADEFLPLFPYQITFSQYGSTGDTKTSRSIVRFEMTEISKLESVDQQWFIVQSGDSTQVDLTEELASRVRFISKSIRTAQQRRNPPLKK